MRRQHVTGGPVEVDAGISELVLRRYQVRPRIRQVPLGLHDLKDRRRPEVVLLLLSIQGLLL